MNLINLNIFHRLGGIYRLVRKSNLWRDESAIGSIQILGGLYIKPGMKIDQCETEKSHIALWSNLSEYLHFFYVWK